ncbi:hypothetical protein BDV93DRAFT_561149 [Ceratobasidium sp. AG-I]|nr:hypothetical protein BDV93DRAFT_561149 [Ceratobasidium sp. AG-I]
MISEETVVRGVTAVFILAAVLFDDSPPKNEVKLPTQDCDSITFQFGEFRLICIDCMQTTLLLLRGTAWQLEPMIKFRREKQLPYFTRISDQLLEPAMDEIVEDIARLVVEYPNEKPEEFIPSGLIEILRSSVKNVLLAKKPEDLVLALYAMTASAAQVWKVVLDTAAASFAKNPPKDQALFQSDMDSIKENGRLPEGATTSSFFQMEHEEKPNRVIFKWKKDTENKKHLLEILRKFAKKSREENKRHSLVDRLAFHAGYYLLSQGQNKIDPYQSRTLGTVGFREDKWQTYLSLTDPGQGHVFGTTTRAEWMKGRLCMLNRPANTTQAQIESYRIPSVLEFARVCLHTGYTSPNTCYVGRPLKDSSDFKYDFIKVVDTVSAACSSMFNLGSAECKIAISGVNSSDAIAYMRALRGHTRKNYRQYFSAAFNLNTPIVDDLNSQYISKPMNIGRRAIELAALGGFDKVTWDGASDSYPSTPLLKLSDAANDHGLLSLQDATELVHRAHSAGLTTYFSAGFKSAHIKIAVHSGVDGIGIGGAQVLRNMDDASKMHGEYKESRIEQLIKERDKAADETLGKAARALARLDQMYFEGSINVNEIDHRTELFDLLREKDHRLDRIDDLLGLETLKKVMEIKEDVKRPWKARADRLLENRRDKKSLLQQCAENKWVTSKWEADPDSQANWDDFASTLKTITEEGQIHSFALSEDWKVLTGRYRDYLNTRYPPDQHPDNTPKYFSGDINYNVKVSPFDGRKNLVVSDVFNEKAHYL